MDIEIIEYVDGGGFGLWDGDRFIADCGKGPDGQARAKMIRDEIVNLRLANDELRATVERLTRERNYLQKVIEG